jgi:ubiquinone/menaquinone biosynthesis C-methylase UbiE
MLRTTKEQARYNNKLFQDLIKIYHAVTIVLLPVRRRIVALLKLHQHARVLEVACGTGTQALILAKEDYLVTGIDLSQAMLKVARSKAGKECHVTFVEGDAAAMPFPKGSFDAALVSFGLHDMPEALRVRVLKEMKRVTKKDGKIIIADYATPSDGLLPRAERRISNLFESIYYDSWMETGLAAYLTKAKMVPVKKEKLLFGVAQIVVCLNQ